MTLAAVVALIPLFYIATGDTSRYYFGRHLWFGYFAVYGIVVYVTRMPWVSILDDFQCHGNATYFCVTECFEKVFTTPITGIWCHFYFVCMGLFFLLEFFLANIQSNKANDTLGKLQGSEENQGAQVAFQELSLSSSMSLNFGHRKTTLILYFLYLVLVMSTQCMFSFFLLYKHLPLVSPSFVHCRGHYCPGPYLCLIRGTMEKRHSIYTLLIFSLITMLFCLGFSLHSLCYYISKNI